MKLNLYQISCLSDRTPNLEYTNPDFAFLQINEFIFKQLKNGFFERDKQLYSQTKSSVSKSKQTANYVKKHQDL